MDEPVIGAGDVERDSRGVSVLRDSVRSLGIVGFSRDGAGAAVGLEGFLLSKSDSEITLS